MTSEFCNFYVASYKKYWGADVIKLTGCCYEGDLQADLKKIDISDCCLSARNVHHLLTYGQGKTEMYFSRCMIGTAALVQLSKWSMYSHSSKAVAKETLLRYELVRIQLGIYISLIISPFL